LKGRDQVDRLAVDKHFQLQGTILARRAIVKCW
jgi:hypothetical protein